MLLSGWISWDLLCLTTPKETYWIKMQNSPEIALAFFPNLNFFDPAIEPWKLHLFSGFQTSWTSLMVVWLKVSFTLDNPSKKPINFLKFGEVSSMGRRWWRFSNSLPAFRLFKAFMKGVRSWEIFLFREQLEHCNSIRCDLEKHTIGSKTTTGTGARPS